MSFKANLDNFAGKVFGRLTTIKYSHMSKNSAQYWECLCSCGNTKVIARSSLLRGMSISCGCFQKEETSKRTLIHGQEKTGLKSPTRTYIIWGGIIARVRRPPAQCYDGITVCKEWEDFTNFLRDMGEVPEGKTIDRIDSTKSYEKSNCRWATPQEQSRNIRKWLTRETSSIYKGVTYLKNKHSWRVVIRTGEKRVYIGSYKTQEEAALAYNEAAKKYHGEFACLNPI